MTYNYKTLEDQQLFLIKYFGLFSFDDYKKSVVEFFQMPNHQNFKFILVDLRNVVHNVKLTAVSELVKERKSEAFHDIKFAYLVDNPQMTVFMELFTTKLQSPNYKYFSTLLAACKYLDLNQKTIQEVNAYLSNK